MRFAPVTVGLDDPEVRDAAVDAAPDAIDFGPTDDGWRSGSLLKMIAP